MTLEMIFKSNNYNLFATYFACFLNCLQSERIMSSAQSTTHSSKLGQHMAGVTQHDNSEKFEISRIILYTSWNFEIPLSYPIFKILGQ